MNFRHLLLIISLLFVQLTSFAQKSVDDRFLEGVQEYTSGQYEKAVSNLDKVIANDPANDAAYYYRGLSKMYLGDGGALADLEKAASMDTTNYWYRDRLALAYNVSGKAAEAMDAYERLTKAFPKKVEPYYTLVNMYLNGGKMDEAVSAITQIEELQGKTDGTVMTKYQILLRQQKQEEALESLKEYSREYSSPQVLAMLGDHEMGMYNDSLAVQYYDEALALDSSYPPALLGKAEVFRMMRKYPEYFSIINGIMDDPDIVADAKADYLGQLLQHVDPKFFQAHRAQLDTTYDTMVKRHPSDTSALQAAGIWYFNTGRPEQAKEVFKKNMDGNPNDLKSALYYLQVLSSTKDYATLVTECEAASKRLPEAEADFDQMIIFAEYNQEHFDKVIAKCEEMIRKAPKDSAVCLDSYTTIGDVWHQLGEPAKAYKAYDKALKINPDFAPVLNNYAYYLSLEGRKLGKAYKMSKKTVEQEPDNSTYLDTFGWILHLMGRDLEAKPFFKHAMLYGGKESATILAHYALVLEKLGETDLANVYKNQAKAKAAEGNE